MGLYLYLFRWLYFAILKYIFTNWFNFNEFWNHSILKLYATFVFLHRFWTLLSVSVLLNFQKIYWLLWRRLGSYTFLCHDLWISLSIFGLPYCFSRDWQRAIFCYFRYCTKLQNLLLKIERSQTFMKWRHSAKQCYLLCLVS